MREMYRDMELTPEDKSNSIIKEADPVMTSDTVNEQLNSLGQLVTVEYNLLQQFSGIFLGIHLIHYKYLLFFMARRGVLIRKPEPSISPQMEYQSAFYHKKLSVPGMRERKEWTTVFAFSSALDKSPISMALCSIPSFCEATKSL